MKAIKVTKFLVVALLLPSGSGFAADTEEEIARELKRSKNTAQRGQGLSNTFNPAISGTVSVLGGGESRPNSDEDHEADDLRTGLHLQEVEVRLSATLDPYFRADITLAGNLEEIGFEEAYLTTLSIPRMNVRAGLMLANLGRHNLLHTHAFPFVTAPLPWRVLLGPEGLRDPGVSADILLPFSFFAEVNLQVFQGNWKPMEGGISDIPETTLDEFVPDFRKEGDFAYVAHLKTLFELSEATTVELGGTVAGGRNGWGGLSSIFGGDFTLKWRPIEAERYTSLEWTTEYVGVDRKKSPTATREGGFYSALRYQFAQRWWVQGRGALLGLPVGEVGRTWRGEALVALVPSEYSALRLQYAFESGEGEASVRVHEVFFQVVLSMGSHPTHAY